MTALTSWTSSPIILILVILVTSPLLTTTAQRQTVRLDRRVTQAQIEEVVKRWYKPEGRRFDNESPAQKVKRLFDCTRGMNGCSGTRLSLLINEILLRLQFHDMGEDCTGSDGKYIFVVYNGSYRSNNDPVAPPAYLAWQDELLDTGLSFCDPYKHLSCSPNSKKCECRPGTVWRPDVNPNACSASLGGNCWFPGLAFPRTFPPHPDISPRYFDLFAERRANENDDKELLPTTCLSGFCTSDFKLFLNNFCGNDEIHGLDNKLEDQFKDLPHLNFGDPCNFDHQTQLFTTKEEEVKDYTIRVKKLEDILAAKPSFCNHSRLLVCGSGGKCECMKPTIYNNEAKLCTFKSALEICTEESRFKKMTDSYPGRVIIDTLNGFEIARKRECPYGCGEVTFFRGPFIQSPDRFCHPCPAAPPGSSIILLVGKNCDKDLTEFLDGAPPPSLPINIPDYDKQVELFVQFNEKAKEFEKLFQLEKNSSCDYEGELEAYRSIRRIKNVELPDKILTEQNYKDLMSSMDKLIAQFGGRGLCRYRFRGQKRVIDISAWSRPLLLCGPTPAPNSTCYESSNEEYLQVLLNRLSGKSFPATPTNGTCSPHPRDVLKYAGEIVETQPTQFSRFSWEGYQYVFDTLENIWIENAGFCNRTGGFNCTKSVPLYGSFVKTNATGTCERSKNFKEEIMTKNNGWTKSSHHSTQHLIPALLFVLHIIILN